MDFYVDIRKRKRNDDADEIVKKVKDEIVAMDADDTIQNVEYKVIPDTIVPSYHWKWTVYMRFFDQQ